jgi:hypothetical protein
MRFRSASQTAIYLLMSSPFHQGSWLPQRKGVSRDCSFHMENGDPVLAIDRCSRRIVPSYNGGYELLYREFNGFILVPGAIAREALDWFIS